MLENKYLQIKNINFYHGSTRILNDLNLDIYRNRITAIIGPSGSGKSTLLRILNRIYELYTNQRVKGEVLFDGQNILDKNIDLNLLRRRIGMVFQKPTPFPNMSIYENIAFALRIHEKLSKTDIYNRVKESLVKTVLWEEVKNNLDKLGVKLSGGQQQRLCMARTIAIRPQILLLDEPTSALDPVSTKKIESLLLELKKQYTIIIATHNLNQVRRISDNTVLIVNGELLEHQKTNILFSNPKDKRTSEYVSYD